MSPEDPGAHSRGVGGLREGRPSYEAAVPADRVEPTGPLPMVLGLVTGLANIGTSGVAVALPSLAGDFGVSTATATWVVSGYAVALAVATPVHGRLADAMGIRAPLCLGLVLLAVGALVSAAAPDFAVMMVARVIQGTGAAATLVLGSALLSARVPADRRGAALGWLAGMAAVLSALGPLLGGALTLGGGWQAAVALPALVGPAVPYLWRRARVSGDGGRLDIIGAAAVVMTVCGLVLLVQSASAGIATAMTGCGLLAIGVPAAVARVRARPHGFLPLSVVTNLRVIGNALCASTIPASWFSLLVGIPLTLTRHGWTPLTIGLLLAPSALAALSTPLVASKLLRRLGPRATLLVATMMTAAGLLVAAVGVACDWVWPLSVAPVLVTLAFGTGQPAMVTAVGGAVPSERRSGAIGVATLCFLVGASVGTAVIGGVGTVLGLAPAWLLLTMLPTVAAVALLLRRDHGPRRACSASVSSTGEDTTLAG
ncbi:MAG: MFS transporter [Nocardioidaceae bacterium]